MLFPLPEHMPTRGGREINFCVTADMLWGTHSSLCKQGGLYQLDHQLGPGLSNRIIGFRFKHTICIKTVESTLLTNHQLQGRASNFLKTGKGIAKNVVFSSLFLRVLCPLFWSGCIYCFHSLFIKAPPPAPATFYTFQTASRSIRQCVSSLAGISFSNIILSVVSVKDVVLPLIAHPSHRRCLVLLQGLMGTYSPQLPLSMMSFRFGLERAQALKGKEERHKKYTHANCAAMKCIRRELQSGSSVRADWRVQEGVCCWHRNSSKTVFGHSNL